MELRATPAFAKWYRQIQADEEVVAEARVRAKWAKAMLTAVRELEGQPAFESATFSRVMVARRYPLWRVAHPHDGVVQVRILVWFEAGTAWCLLGGDKSGIDEQWYQAATVQAESLVGAINLRRNEGKR